MPITPPFKSVPKDVVEWARFFRDTRVLPSDDSVGEDQLQNGEVTYRKIQDVSPDRLLGRDSSPAGQVQELTVSNGLEFTGTGIRRSALTGDILAAAGSNTTAFRNGTARSVLGRAGATAGTMGDIVAASDNQFLVRRAGSLAFDGLADADIPSSITRDTELTAAIAALGLASGTYTPALTNVANIDGSSAFVCQYLRVGNAAHVSGALTVDNTASATLTRIGISLPIASNFASSVECAGTCSESGTVNQFGPVVGDATNDRAELRFIAADTSNHTIYFTFTYLIIP